MNTQDCFLVAYRQQRPTLADQLLQNLTEAQIRTAPMAGVNTVAWLVWHMARTEDVVVNRMLADGRQVFEAGDWGRRLGVTVREFGVGMGADEVRAISGRVDLGALQAYWAAVGDGTERVVAGFQPGDLDAVIAPDHVQRVIDAEGIIPMLPWICDLAHASWSGKTKAFMLGYYGYGHNLLHFGEGLAIRGMMDHAGR